MSQRTCSSKCARQWGVDKRKKNGTYKRTSKQNKKLSTTLKRQYKTGERKPTVDKAIEALKDPDRQEEIQRKKQATCIQNWGVSHWMKTATGKAFAREIHSGKKVSKETRRKMSLNSQKQTHRFSRCKGGFREDLGMYFRSSWEANYARYLNYQGISWTYESETFELEPGVTYTPDFVLSNQSYVEIKGWLTEKAKNKLRLFKEQYPHASLELVQRKKYRALYATYSTIIPFWEKVNT